MMRKKIAFIFGGFSPEYVVSLKSAAEVLSHLNRDRYEAVKIGITKEGKWYLYEGAEAHILRDDWHQDKAHLYPAMLLADRIHSGLMCFKNGKNMLIPLDGVFPVLHGQYGEDGTIQGLIRLSGLPLIGCGVLSSALCMDKYRAHLLVKTQGILVPQNILVKKNNVPGQGLLEGFSYPFFVKPLRAGSSLGISLVQKQADLFSALQKAFVYDDEALLEEKIEGKEVGCAILGNKVLQMGAVDEIELQKDFFDYDEKYGDRTTQIHVPAKIEAEMSQKIQETARKIYEILDCRGLSRVDLFLTPQNTLVFNEVNTLPGLTAHSRYPKMLENKGISFSQMVEMLIEQSLAIEPEA